MGIDRCEDAERPPVAVRCSADRVDPSSARRAPVRRLLLLLLLLLLDPGQDGLGGGEDGTIRQL